MEQPPYTLLPGWEWLPGMLVHLYSVPRRLLALREDDFLGEPVLEGLIDQEEGAPKWVNLRYVLLCPEDPATGGCLLSLLGDDIEVWMEPGAVYVRPYSADETQGPSWSGETLGEACINMALDRGYWRRA
jgi:hypothetical protein